jgi:AcrR family transcriptional regulator
MPGMGIAERKARQKQAMRERILDAARRIAMREGFTALSMRKIADAIEYSPASLYLHVASRDEIVQALCAEGYSELLASLVPLAQIADPAQRLKALGRAYVAFGAAHPQTYRLIFMEDSSYTGAALGGRAAASVEVAAGADTEKAGEGASGDLADPADTTGAPQAHDDSGDASLRLMTDALDELKSTGRLPASTDVAVWADAFWAALHGIVALNLTCPVFPAAPLGAVVDVTLDVWFGAQLPIAAATRAVAATRTRTRKSSAKPHAKPKAANA